MMDSSKLRSAWGVALQPRAPSERKEPIMIATLCAAALLAAAVFILAGCIATAAL